MIRKKEEQEELKLTFLNELWQRKEDLETLSEDKKNDKSILFRPSLVLKSIAEVIEESTDEQKQLIQMYYEMHYGYVDIADELYTKVSRVKKLHQRILHKFGEKIGFVL